MTAVAQPPNLESLPRSGWNLSGSGGQGAFSAEEVTRMFATRKAPQRTSSSTSLSSNSSTTSKSSDSTTITSVLDLKARKELASQGKEKAGWAQARYGRGFLPQPKTESPTSTGVTPLNGRSQVIPPSNVVAVPTSSTPHQGPLLISSLQMVQPPQMQANGVRMGMGPTGSDPPSLLVLLPMNGTFERKQMSVPLFPDNLRIGRQTNAKTVPTPTNGYFDSKVLSRQHAEVWSDRSGKIWIRDVKSSNGTFVNGVRLSPESRESEPHELRENDMLELGIDIVSEDQKSIVHHKVSAKVEHAGIPTNATSVLDLNLGDIEPGSGGGLSMLPQSGPLRGRLGSQGSVTTNGRPGAYPMGAGGVNALGGVQRHMGAWLSPITIEQVVKRLTGEMRQAKQQSHDLGRTGEFFTALLDTEPGEAPPKPPSDLFQSPPPPAPLPLVNGISPHKADHISPFSQPPAPPPQLPLPEKPDATRSTQFDPTATDSRRMDIDKSFATSLGSPSKMDPSSSQIMQLVDALSSAKREIDSQGTRVRQLEEQLKQERRAREHAEERARHLLDRSKIMAGPQILANGVSNSRNQESIRESPSTETLRSLSNGVNQDTEMTGALAEKLQERVNSMLREFEEMKVQMDTYKQRAESAEEERSSLAEMVEQIRQGNTQSRSSPNSLKKKKSSEMATQTDAFSKANGSIHTSQANQGSVNEYPGQEANGSIDKPHAQIKQLQNAMSTALSLHQDDRIMQSAPYASIIGVVLIGVGIMTYLNGWHKLERP